jgi:hypothetical protein
VELSVAGLPLEDSDLSALLRALPRLRVLDISGCQKLSPGAANILVRGSRLATSHPVRPGAQAQLGPGGALPTLQEFSTSGSSPPWQPQQQQQTTRSHTGGLQVLDMQRCFQLEAPALSTVLAALRSCALAAVLCSHLTMDSWPPGGAPRTCATADCAAGAKSTAPAQLCARPDALPPSARHQLGCAQPLQPALLRVLALHNCVMLTPAGLQVSPPCIEHAQCDCTQPHMHVAGSVSASGAYIVAAVASARNPSGCCLALQAIAAACPHLQLLLLGGSTIGATPQGRAGQVPGDAETRDAAVAAVRAWTDAHSDRCCPPEVPLTSAECWCL